MPCLWSTFIETIATKGSHRLKKVEFYETFSQTGGRGQPDFISLIQKCFAPKKARKNQNKDFIKAVCIVAKSVFVSGILFFEAEFS